MLVKECTVSTSYVISHTGYSFWPLYIINIFYISHYDKIAHQFHKVAPGAYFTSARIWNQTQLLNAHRISHNFVNNVCFNMLIDNKTSPCRTLMIIYSLRLFFIIISKMCCMHHFNFCVFPKFHIMLPEVCKSVY